VLNHTGYSHPFDEDGAKGYIRCEGVGAIVLRRLSDAERDGNSILCEMPNAVAGSAGPEDGAWCSGISMWMCFLPSPNVWVPYGVACRRV
jgi:hypothetical protein